MTLILFFQKSKVTFQINWHPQHVTRKSFSMWSHDQTACAKTLLNWSRRSENAQGLVCDFEKSRIFFRFFFQKLKIFEGNTVIVKTFSKYFLSCTLGVGYVLLVVSRLQWWIFEVRGPKQGFPKLDVL